MFFQAMVNFEIIASNNIFQTSGKKTFKTHILGFYFITLHLFVFSSIKHNFKGCFLEKLSALHTPNFTILFISVLSFTEGFVHISFAWFI